MKSLPISMTKLALESIITKHPDEPRMRFIGGALEAARLAMQMDAPHHDIAPRLRALMRMMDVNLTAWDAEPEE